MNRVWAAALRADPSRRDREGLIAAAVRLAMSGRLPSWGKIGDPEDRRRAGYLVELGQRMRGQRSEEAASLDAIRRSLPPRSAGPFWPGEGTSPASVDQIAEKWGFTRGVNVLRVRAALGLLKRGRNIGVLPALSLARRRTPHEAG